MTAFSNCGVLHAAKDVHMASTAASSALVRLLALVLLLIELLLRSLKDCILGNSKGRVVKGKLAEDTTRRTLSSPLELSLLLLPLKLDARLDDRAGTTSSKTSFGRDKVCLSKKANRFHREDAMVKRARASK